jgi:hypothetical protein
LCPAAVFYRHPLDKVIRPALGATKADKLTRAQVAKLHGSLMATPFQANRVLAVIGSMYAFARPKRHRAGRHEPLPTDRQVQGAPARAVPGTARNLSGSGRDAAKRQFDMVMAWSVDRLGRSLQDLVGFLHGSGMTPETATLLVEFMRSHAGDILQYVAPFPELRSYVEWVIRHLDRTEGPRELRLSTVTKTA